MAGRTAGLLVLLAMAILFSVTGAIVGFVFGLPVVDEAKASTNWPTVEGTVTESRLETSRSDKSTMYSAHVIYEYTVGGLVLDCDRIWFGGDYSTSDRDEMAKVVRDYPVGKKVTVYHSPDDAAVAVLQPGAFFSTWIMFIVGMVFLGAGVILFLAFMGVFFFGRKKAALSGSERSFADQFDDGTSNDRFSDPHGFDDE